MFYIPVDFILVEKLIAWFPFDAMIFYSLAWTSLTKHSHFCVFWEWRDSSVAVCSVFVWYNHFFISTYNKKNIYSVLLSDFDKEVKFHISTVKQYVWVINMRIALPHTFDFFYYTIAGILHGFKLTVKLGVKSFPPRINNHFYSIQGIC